MLLKVLEGFFTTYYWLTNDLLMTYYHLLQANLRNWKYTFYLLNTWAWHSCTVGLVIIIITVFYWHLFRRIRSHNASKGMYKNMYKYKLCFFACCFAQEENVFGPEDNLFSGEEIMDFVERKKLDDLSTHQISFFLQNLFDAGLLDFVKLRNIIGPNRLRATMYKWLSIYYQGRIIFIGNSIDRVEYVYVSNDKQSLWACG